MVLRSLVLLDDAEGSHRPPLFQCSGNGNLQPSNSCKLFGNEMETFPQT
jgi:hypothetical protein